MMRFTKAILLAVLGVAALAADSRAAFSVAISGPGATGTTVTPLLNAGASTGTAIFGVSGNFSGSITSTASQGTLSATLGSSLQLQYLGTTPSGSITITVTQNAYTFPQPVQLFSASGSYTVGATGNAATGIGISTTASGQGVIAPFTNATGATGTSNSSTPPPVAGLPSGVPPQFISQTFTFAGLATNQSITLGETSTIQSIITPAPDTLLAAVSGLPLLGVAGLIRRRFLGV